LNIEARPVATFFEFILVYVASPHMDFQHKIRRSHFWARAGVNCQFGDYKVFLGGKFVTILSAIPFVMD